MGPSFPRTSSGSGPWKASDLLKYGTTSLQDQPWHPNLFCQSSKVRGSPRTQIIWLMLLQPPSTRPRGQNDVRPVTFCGTVSYFQSRSLPCKWILPKKGDLTLDCWLSPPASTSSTDLPRSARRDATTQPAEPAPTTMKSNTAFAMGIQQPLEHRNSYTEFQPFECHVTCVWVFCPACCIFKKLEVFPHSIHWRHMCPLQGNTTSRNTSAWRAEKGSLFGSSNIDSVLPLEIQLIFFSLYWARTPSEYHNDTPVRSPMNLL